MVKRNKFSLSCDKLLTCNMGELVPINMIDVIPGDSIQQSTSMLIRTLPLVAPLMHRVQVRIHHFFVPYRIIWNDWESFITGGETGADASTFPTITFASNAAGTLADHLGLPKTSNSMVVSALPFRAYNLIYNEHYRDQDLQTARVIDLTDGADSTTDTTLELVNWQKDYLTGIRPDTEKGSEVTVPLGTSADVYTDAANSADVGVYGTVNSDYVKMGANTTYLYKDATTVTSGNRLYADLSGATAATINQLREAFALQKFAEARMRYGARYTEYLRYCGVVPEDSRLDRPEYLGGGKNNIQFSEVVQTAPTTSGSTSGIGDLYGHGLGAVRTNRFRKFFREHGLVMTLMSCRPKPLYSQGINKYWLKTDNMDFFQKELQHIGMDEVINREVYHDHASPTDTFGYKDRYDEYRKGLSTVSGEFNPNENLENWHMAREFTSDPALNDTFITCTPTNRVYENTTDHELQIMAGHSIQARRPIAKVGTPGGITF